MGAAIALEFTPPCEGVAPLGAPSQRRYGAGPRFLTFRSPAFGFRAQPLLGSRTVEPRAGLNGPPSASSSQGVVVPPGGAPAPPERVPLLRARPRAPALPPRSAQPVRVPSGDRAGC